MKKFLVIVQLILTLACLVLGVMYLFSDNRLVIDILEVTAGVDLLLMGLNTYLIHKNKKGTIIYVVVGLIMIMTVVLSKLGVI